MLVSAHSDGVNRPGSEVYLSVPEKELWNIVSSTYAVDHEASMVSGTVYLGDRKHQRRVCEKSGLQLRGFSKGRLTSGRQAGGKRAMFLGYGGEMGR